MTWKFNADPNTEGNVSFTVKVNESISGENGEIDNSALVGNRKKDLPESKSASFILMPSRDSFVIEILFPL